MRVDWVRRRAFSIHATSCILHERRGKRRGLGLAEDVLLVSHDIPVHVTPDATPLVTVSPLLFALDYFCVTMTAICRQSLTADSLPSFTLSMVTRQPAMHTIYHVAC